MCRLVKLSACGSGRRITQLGQFLSELPTVQFIAFNRDGTGLDIDFYTLNAIEWGKAVLYIGGAAATFNIEDFKVFSLHKFTPLLSSIRQTCR